MEADEEAYGANEGVLGILVLHPCAKELGIPVRGGSDIGHKEHDRFEVLEHRGLLWSPWLNG